MGMRRCWGSLPVDPWRPTHLLIRHFILDALVLSSAPVNVPTEGFCAIRVIGAIRVGSSTQRPDTVAVASPR